MRLTKQWLAIVAIIAVAVAGLIYVVRSRQMEANHQRRLAEEHRLAAERPQLPYPTASPIAAKAVNA